MKSVQSEFGLRAGEPLDLEDPVSQQTMRRVAEASTSPGELRSFFDDALDLAEGELLFEAKTYDVLAEASFGWEKHPELDLILFCMARGTYFNPTNILSPDLNPSLLDETHASYEDQERWLVGFESQKQLYERLLFSASPRTRTAAALCLARCRDVGRGDVATLISAAQSETSQTTQAALMVALAAVFLRLFPNDESVAVDQSSAEMARALQSDSRVVRCAAVAAEAAWRRKLSEQRATILLDGLQSEAPLGWEWGWRGPFEGASTIRHLVTNVLCWARVPNPEVFISALSSHGKHPATVDRACSAVIWLGFEFDGIGVPDSGLALDDLTESQVRALKLIEMHGDHHHVERLGFCSPVRSIIASFLAADEPRWRPIRIRLGSERKESFWPFSKIMLEVAFGRISPQNAASDLLDSLSPAEALKLVLSHHLFHSKLQTEKHRRRVQDVVIALGSLLKAQEQQLSQLFSQAAISPREYHPGIVANAWIEMDGICCTCLPPEFDEFLSLAAAHNWLQEPLRSFLSKLPSERLEGILARFPAPDFSDLLMTPQVVDALVEFATDEDFEGGVAALARGGAKALSLLESYRDAAPQVVEAVARRIVQVD